MQRTYDQQIASLLQWYRTTSEDTKDEGRQWYSEQREVLRVLADQYDVSVCTVAAVAAAMSPLTHWHRNVAGTIRILRAWQAGEDAAPRNCTTFYRNARKAWSILTSETDPESAFKGSPKVNAFWRNLCGDEDAVTIDTWMLHAVGEERLARQGIKPAPYRTVAETVRDAAEMVGETPAAFQAIVWLAIRGEMSRTKTWDKEAA